MTDRTHPDSGCITNPVAAYAAQDSEHQRAIMEGERNASLDAYSRVVSITSAESRLYERAFTSGWDRLASYGQAPAQTAPATAYAELPEPLEIEWPELHSSALGCGVEDRGLHNRYECAEYGWQDGVDKCAERVPEQIFDADQMRAFADATHALRVAPHGQAPAQASPAEWLEQAFREGWAACRDAEFVGEQAEDWAFGNSSANSRMIDIQQAAPAAVAGPALDFADAYEGAREDLAIWKRRALAAERDLRAEQETSSRLAAEINALNGPTRMGEPAAVAGPSEFPHEQMDVMALARYKVMPSHESMFHRHVVVAGDGSQQLYIGREVECENMARKFAGAFLDGAFAFHSMLAAAPTAQPAPQLPERDASVPAEQQGLFRKFDVRRVDGSDKPGGKHHGCTYFVLDVDHDPCARPALAAYAAACESTHPALAADLRTKWGAVPTTQPAPNEDEGISREQWIEQAMRVYLIAGDTEQQAEECAKYLWGELDLDDLADPYDAAMSDVEGRGPAPQPSPAAQGDALDTIRLDWLDADESRCVFHLGKSWYTRPSYGMPYRKRASLREAIDAARAAQEGK